MHHRKTYLLFLLAFILVVPQAASAQRKKKKEEKRPKTIYEIDTLVQPISKQRAFFHDKFRKALRGADVYDGSVDGVIYIEGDTLATRIFTQTMLRDAAHLDTMIENLPFADKQQENQTKIGYLNAVTNLVYKFNHDTKPDVYYYRKLVNNERDLLIALHQNKVDEFVRANANKYTLANAELLKAYPDAKAYLYTEVGKQEPVMMIRRLSEYANEGYSCDIITEAARVAPNEIFTYASSTNYTVRNAVRRCKDPLVQAIVRVADESKAPLKAMSFISDIYNGKKTIAEIDHITSDQDLYYKNLVRLKLEQQTLGGRSFTDELQYRGLKYVRTMNDLHESPDPVRFKCIEGLSPAELYFLMVYGQDEIYTSSFIGTFNRMMERLKPTPGDSLLAQVNYEHFRTFIRMCAGYNKLSEFLATMQPDQKTTLMKSFIANLESGKEDDLEDAVDVADAFGSIGDSSLADFLRDEVRQNYERVGKLKSRKGVIVYGLLSTLFQGMKGGNSPEDIIRLSESVGLQPLNLVPYQTLAGDKDTVFEQFYFYGDEDGKMSYNSFLTNFKDGKWKVVNTNKYWTTINSVAGKPVVIFANMPLQEEGQDEEAQQQLNTYLGERGIRPTIVVHRGHSYHLPTTLENLRRQNRIVMLGSCGGYHMLGQVLDAAPDAQIISTKQTGTAVNNEAIIRAINTRLLEGVDIDWIAMWNELNNYFKGKGAAETTFREYVPPHRNLGVIFIKAYRRILNTDES